MVITNNISSTFQYTFFTTCHPPGAKEGFVKGEALRLLRTNSSVKTFEENITTFKKHLLERRYPQNLINNTLRSEISRKDTSPHATKQNKKTNLALHKTIPPSTSKSQRNLKKEVVSNTVTTIAKSNLQGTAHNIIQKGALT